MKVDDLSPEIRVIYDELVAIRRNGLGFETIHDHGHHIQQLECVSAELRKPPLNRDRVTAAVAAVRCAVARLRRIQDRTYLSYVLLEPERVGGRWSVLDRQKAAERALGKLDVDFIRNKSTEKMKAAHIELASLLVGLNEAPCEEFDGRAQAAEMALYYEDSLADAGRIFSRISRLCQLGVASSPATRSELERLISISFPTALEKLKWSGARRFVYTLVEAVVFGAMHFEDLSFVDNASSAHTYGQRVFLASLGILSAELAQLGTEYATFLQSSIQRDAHWWEAVYRLVFLMDEQEHLGWPILHAE